MRRGLSLAALLLASVALLLVPGTASAAFGFLPGAEGFSVAATKQDGTPVKQAGAHPYAFEADVGLHTSGGASDGDLRDLHLSLPPGFLINPTVVTECSAAAFATPRSSPYESSASGENCPNSSQVGVLEVNVGGTSRHFGLFNLVPPFGAAAAIGASPFGVPLVLLSHLRESDYGFDLALTDLPQSFDLQKAQLTIWGTPWQGAHDTQRGNCLNEQTGGSFGECLVFDSVGAPAEFIKSYLTVPTTPCGQPLAFTATASSWQGANASANSSGAPLEKCNKALTTPKVQLMSENAAARTGLAFNLYVNDGGGITNPAGIARPAIKQAIVSLPEGLTINPSLGAGLGTCAETQFAAESATSEPGAGCPNNSKIGTVNLEGALALSEPLQGSLYIAKPYGNPFHTLLAVYMLGRLPRRGLIVKSEGKLEPDPKTGRLVATFDDLPRLLYEHFTLTLREGQRSTLVSPSICGSYLADLQVASWAEPTVFRHEASAFAITHGEAGGPCPSGGLPPFKPGLLAGSINPQARAYTPFYLRMTRTDAEQEITSYSASFPPGLLGNISGVSACPDALIEAAKQKSGVAELEHPSCPASSSIGHTIAGYGVGGTLAWAPGGLYLAGPYHGSPLSTVAIDSALVGPFDLGVVVVRSAVRVNPRTAQVSLDSAGSDPIPHILDGIPLHLRDIRVYVDRSHLMLNPTSCDPMKVSSTLGGAGADPFSLQDDTLATSSQRYQVLNCTVLGFKPKLQIALSATRHRAFPALRATYATRPGDANLQAISVTLPPSLFLAQGHIKDICTKSQFAKEACPPSSAYGSATATSPLLAEPLTGPVYFRSSSHSVPDIVADLKGRGIEIEVPGRIDQSRGGIRASFESLPDAPVTKFTMTLAGGRRGLLQNAEDLCGAPQRLNVRFIGQNNATEVTHPALGLRCGKGRKGGKGK